MAETPELLPLGSAVQIVDDQGVFVVIARGFQRHEDGFLAGYKAVPHPQGAGSGVREIVIRQTQIARVLRSGYENQEDAVFASEQLAHAKAPPTKQPTSVAEPDLTIVPGVPSVGARSGTESPPQSTATDINDPFGELRRKGKRS